MTRPSRVAIVAGTGEGDLDESVAFLDVDGDDAAAVDVAVVGQGGALDGAVGQDEGDGAFLIEATDGEDVDDALFLLEALDDVDDGGSGGGAAGLGDLEGALGVDAAGVGEEEEGVVRQGDVDALDEVFVLDEDALLALAAALLGGVDGEGGALDVAAVGEGDDAGFVGHEVLEVDVAGHGDDLGEAVAFLGVGGLDVLEVLGDEGEDLGGVFEDGLELGDLGAEVGLLGEELVALEAGELAEAHFEDGGDLGVGETEALAEAGLGLVVGLGVADDVDDLVEVVLGDEEAIDDVEALLGLGELETATAGVHLEAVVDVALEEVAQGHAARAAMIQGDHVRAEGGLQVAVFVELVEDDGTGLGVLLQLDDDADAVLQAGLIADVGDALDDAGLDELGHLGDHRGLVDHVGDGGDEDGLMLAVLDDLGLAAHGDGAAAGLVHRLDAGAAADEGAGGEVGALDELHELIDGGVGVGHKVDEAVAEFAQVVRRDVGGHAHGDALGAIEEQVGQLGGEDARLHRGVVVVRDEVDGVFVDVGEHLVGDFRQAGLGVTVGRRAVAVDGAEVAVAVHELFAHAEPLGQAHQGVIDGAVAVRVILTHHVTHHAGALAVGRVEEVLVFVHRVEHAPVHRLEPIARIRQGTRHDDAHRVVDVGALHLLLDVD